MLYWLGNTIGILNILEWLGEHLGRVILTSWKAYRDVLEGLYRHLRRVNGCLRRQMKSFQEVPLSLYDPQ